MSADTIVGWVLIVAGHVGLAVHLLLERAAERRRLQRRRRYRA